MIINLDKTFPIIDQDNDGTIFHDNWIAIDIAVDAKLNIDGTDPMTGPLTLAGDPTSPLEATTKQYVDTNLASSSPIGNEGQIPFNALTGSRQYESGYSVVEGRFVDTAQELIDAKLIFFTFDDVFNTWFRFSHSTSLTFPANPSELTAWAFDSGTDQISSTVNSSTYIGLISNDFFTNYLFEAQMSSINADDDAIGIVLAFTTEGTFGQPGYKEFTLSAIRTMGGLGTGGNEIWQIIYNFAQSDTFVVADGSSTLTQWFKSDGSSGLGNQGWLDAGIGVPIKAERVGDIITITTGEANTNVLLAVTDLIVDLSSDTRLDKFRSQVQLGFSAFSQNAATWSDVNLVLSDNIIYDLISGDVFVFDGVQFTVDPGRTLTGDIGFGRIIINPTVSKAWFIDRDGNTPSISRDSAILISSVFGRIGDIVAVNGDYTASQITNVPAGNIIAIDVQAALNELDVEKATSAQGALADSALQSGDNISLLTNDSGFVTTSGLINVVEDLTPQLGGQLDAQTNKIINLADPMLAQDAATKAYVDTTANVVSSVFGRTGAVIAVSGDYTASQITNVPAGNIVAVDIQAAINELDVEKATSAQGALADSALQTGDNISLLTNDSGFVTSSGIFNVVEDLTPQLGGNLDAQTNKIINLPDPTADQDAATKAYVDALSTGLDVKASVRATTTANITLSGTQTIDTVVLIVGDRVLVKDQTTGDLNGIYIVGSGAWTRSTDADNNPSGEVTSGMFTFVEEGLASGTGWVLTTANPITLGVTSLTFTQFSDSTIPVTSVFGRTGAVIAVSGDYTSSQITNIPAGNIVAVDVQAALNELDVEKATSAQGALADSALQSGDNISLLTNDSGFVTTSGLINVVEDLTPQLGGNLDTQTFTVDGRDVSVDGTKLDGIEIGATADQTGAEIKTAYELEANTNAFTDAEQTKLSGIATGATANPNAIDNVVEDTTPQLGGSLDAQNNKITSLGTPTLDGDAATKAYVDGVATGLDLKGSVKAATTANITLLAAQTVDTVVLIAGDRVLVKNQSTASQNGLYTVQAAAWIRTTDADNTPTGEVTTGLFTFVEEGTQSGTGWVLITTGTIVLDTTGLTFAQFSDTTAPVSSVNSQTGVVVLDADDISDASTTNKYTTAGDITKLAGIEIGATADQTGAEIKIAYEGEVGAFVAADRTKLDGIETAATADQTGAEIKIAYELEANTNAFTDAEQTKLTGVATSATANPLAIDNIVEDTTPQLGGALDVQANAINTSTLNASITLTPNGTGNLLVTTGDIVLSEVGALIDGRDVGVDGTKLDGIETAATADQTNAEIKTAYELNANTNAFTDANSTTLGTALQDIVTDTTPQLGGNLDVNGQSIVSAAAGNIAITPDTTGKIILDGLSWPTADGTVNQVLQTDGVGNLTFTTAAAAVITSVFGRTGAVIAVSGDYTASQITNVPTGSIAAITVQAALNELDVEKATTAQGALADSALQSGDNISLLTNDSGFITGVSTLSIGSLSDVDVTGLVNDDVLQWDGANFVTKTVFEAEKLIISSLGTGWLDGGVVTINVSTTTIDIAAGNGLVVDNTDPNNPIITKVSWSAFINEPVLNLATQNITWFSINSSGAIIKSNTSPTTAQFRDLITLAAVSHESNTVINSINLAANPVFDVSKSLHDFTNAFGNITLNGLVFSSNNSNLTMDRNAGTSFSLGSNAQNNPKDPNILSSSGVSALTFTPFRTDGVGGFTTLTPTTTIDPDSIDLLTGALGTVQADFFTIQRLYFVPHSQQHLVQFGSVEYELIEEAIAAIDVEETPQSAVLSGALRGWLIVRSEITNLSVAMDARFITADKFGINVSGIAAGIGAVVEDTSPALGGNLNANGFNITMTGTETVDGRDLSVDGAKLDGIQALSTANPNALDNIIEDITPQLGGQLDAQSNKIINLGTPTANGDATTKLYVDGLAANPVSMIDDFHGCIETPINQGHLLMLVPPFSFDISQIDLQLSTGTLSAQLRVNNVLVGPVHSVTSTLLTNSTIVNVLAGQKVQLIVTSSVAAIDLGFSIKRIRT